MIDRIFRFGFVLAGLVNIIGILVITRFFNSPTLREADPAVFSDFGILMIMLWGLAYIGSSRFATTAVLLPLVFAIEKLAYTANWFFWMRDYGQSVADISASDALGALFLGGYGVNDGLFGLFFLAVAVANWWRLR